MTAIVKRVTEVTDHPSKPETVSVVKAGDVQFVAQKITKMGGFKERYAVGDLVVFASDGSIMPEYLLRPGYWDESKGKGVLRGSKGNRVKASNFSGVMSDGIHFEVNKRPDANEADAFYVENSVSEHLTVHEGDDVSGFLGITEWDGK